MEVVKLMEKDMNPKISVVIPCFRAGDYLADAIESVLNQTEKDWELILVDNNSSKDTKLVISKYVNLFPDKIRTIFEDVQGVCSARNKGILESRGTYIALLDDDDLMYPDRLRLQKDKLERNPNHVMCYGKMDKVSGDNSLILESCVSPNTFVHFLGLSSSIAKKNSLVLDFKELMPSTMFFKKDSAIGIGLFDPHFNPCFLEDSDFCFRMSQIGEFIEVDMPIVRFRIPDKEFLKKKRINILEKYRLLQNQDYFLSKILKMIIKNNIDDNKNIKADLKKMKSRWLREASFDFMTIPCGIRYSRILLLRSIKENAFNFKSIKHLLRTFFPQNIREKMYKSQQIYDEKLSLDITEKIIREIYKSQHHCDFCNKL